MKRFQNFKKKYLHFTTEALPAVFVCVSEKERMIKSLYILNAYTFYPNPYQQSHLKLKSFQSSVSYLCLQSFTNTVKTMLVFLHHQNLKKVINILNLLHPDTSSYQQIRTTFKGD